MTDSTPPVTPPPAAAPGPKQTLSLVSFITGLAGFVFSWIPVLGLGAAIAAIITGVQARTKEPGAPKWMWIVGIIAGAVGILGSIIWTLSWLVPIILIATSGVAYSY